MSISSRYAWLSDIPGCPKMILEAVKLGKLNTKEIAGSKNNPVIMDMAKEANVQDLYRNDDMAWCALAHTIIALRAGKEVAFKGWSRLRAISFKDWGVPVSSPMFGDTCIFSRPGGNHVGLYVGEDETHYHIAGGNQSNEYSVTRLGKVRLTYARRPIFKTSQPIGVKKIFLEAVGSVSDNEA